MGGASGGSPAVAQGGELNLYYSTDVNDAFKRVLDAFTEETGITVNYEVYPEGYQNVQQLLSTRLASGDSGFDVFWCDDIMTPMYASAGWIVELTPVVDEFGIDIEDWPTAIVSDVSTYDGGLFRLPWQSDIEIFMYRTDYFEEAGITELPTDWASFLEAAQKLTSAPDRFAIGLNGLANGALVNDIQHWTLQAGASVRALDHPGAREALVFYKDLFTTNGVAPPSSPQDDYNTNLQSFLDGRLAMWWVWDAFYGRLTLEPDFWNDQVDAFATLPSGPDNSGTSIGAWGWAINANAANMDQAKEWVAFTSRPEVMKNLMYRATTPARTSLWADPEYQETTPQIALLSAMQDAGNPFVGRPVSAGFQEVSDAAEQNVNAFLTDQVDVDTAIERAMDRINEINEREAQ